jgi:hypothetical protein
MNEVKDRKILEAQQEKDQTILQVQCNIMFFSGLMNEDEYHILKMFSDIVDVSLFGIRVLCMQK